MIEAQQTGFFVRQKAGGNASGCPMADRYNVRAMSRQQQVAGGFNTSNPQIILSGLDNTNDHTKIYQNWVNWDFGLHPISPANPVTQTRTLAAPTTVTFSPADAQSAIHGNYGEIGFRSAAI
jgi:hypothetical protein